ncbi:MFS general substrate transporter [Mycena vulgaris]|nr:MFS general substrate transporter [Mycena vulgaris]
MNERVQHVVTVTSGEASDPSRWRGTARVLGPSWSHLPTLTVGLLGVQIFWSVEMSYASPYLLSLGLSTSHVALVFLAGPFSGLVVQPLVGAFADTSTSRWGRRRPYILAGCMICVVGMLLLGYTKAVAGVFTAHGSHAHDVLTTVLAVLSIFIIDFSINAVQAVDRALLVDTIPPAQQAAANACAALMLGLGSVVGFFIGNLPLRTLLPFLQADSELQALAALVSVLLLACHALTAALVRERVLLAVPNAPRASLTRELRDIYTHARALPRVIRQICLIQFFAWLGWFPVLFYTTMYIADVYRGSLPSSPSSSLAVNATSSLATNASSSLAANASSSLAANASYSLRANATSTLGTALANSTLGPTPGADLDPDAPTRLGARAQLLSALLALATNALLPLLIPPPKPARRGLRNSRLMGRVDLSAVSPVDGVPLREWERKSSGWRRWGRRWRVPEAARVPLPTLWAASHAVFAACMLGSFFTHSVAGATLLIAATGFSWGVTQWAPFSLLAEAILTAPAPAATASASIRLADARTTDQAEAAFLVGGSDSDSNSDSDSDDGGGEDAKTHLTGNGVNGNGNGHGEGNGVHEDGGRRGGRGRGAGALLGNPHAQLSVVDVLTPLSTRFPAGPDRDAELGEGEGGDAEGGEGEGGLSAKAGVILGIHNIFIVVPQFLVTGLAAAVFAVADGAPPPAVPGHPAQQGDGEGRNSVVYVFRIGGIWASIAFVLAWRLARELRRR